MGALANLPADAALTLTVLAVVISFGAAWITGRIVTGEGR